MPPNGQELSRRRVRSVTTHEPKRCKDENKHQKGPRLGGRLQRLVSQRSPILLISPPYPTASLPFAQHQLLGGQRAACCWRCAGRRDTLSGSDQRRLRPRTSLHLGPRCGPPTASARAGIGSHGGQRRSLKPLVLCRPGWLLPLAQSASLSAFRPPCAG
jgi:hypothetical protein